MLVGRWNAGISIDGNLMVFGKAEKFKVMTKLVERAGYEDMENVIEQNLPIPEIITGR